MKKLYSLIFILAIFTLPALQAQDPLNSDTIDVLSYTITLDDVNYSAQTLKGHTLIQGVSKMNNIQVLPFELWGPGVDSVTGQNIQSFEHANWSLRIFLSSALQAGDTFLVDVYYQGHPVVDPTGWGGFLFQDGLAYNLGVGFGADPHNLGKTWFPCVDDFVDRASYEYFITTSLDKTAVCGGTLLDVQTLASDSTKQVFHWKLNEEIPTYLASVAVSNFQLLADTFQGIEAQIPVHLYVQPQYSGPIQSSFIHLEDAFHAFETAFGPYRWPRVGYINAPVGSMEHACNIAFANGLINGTTNYETTMAHELSHHWFGNLITCESALDMWINEGWASFCEEIFTEAVYGKEEAKKYARRNHEKNIRLLHHTEGWLPLFGIPTDMTYSSTVYDKGADVAHSLRGYLGDSLFYSVITELLSDSAYEDISSDEFNAYLTQHTGINTSDFFDAYVFNPGWNHFSVDSFRVDAGTGLYNVHVYMRQQLKHMPDFANSNRLNITFWSEDWQKETRLMTFDGEFGEQSFQLSFIPVACMTDMEEDFQDATTDEYFVVSEPGFGTLNECYFKYEINDLSDSALIRVTQNWIAPEPFMDAPQNLILSDSRYWTVEGIIPNLFDANFKFSYNNNTGANGYFDDSWFTYPMSADSLVLLYRSSTNQDWQIVPSERLGTSRYGYLSTPNTLLGEYTLAYRDRSLSVDLISAEQKMNLKVYPNPSSGMIHLKWNANERVELSALNDAGCEVYKKKFPPRKNKIQIDAMDWPAGIYFFKLESKGGALDSASLIINPQ